jgi:integrase
MQLSHLIRFLEKNRLGFLQLTDAYFTMFIKGLMPNHDKQAEPTMVADSARAIGSICIDCISYVATLFNYPDFVGKKKVIKAYKVEPYMRRKMPARYRKIVWYHPSFPVSSGDRRRDPITASAISALKAAARKLPVFLASRSRTMIDILVHTGCRRSEAARIQVPDVMRAYRSDLSHPLVRVPSAKGDNTYRYVPVPHVVIKTWVENYIESTRFDLIQKLKGRAQYSNFQEHGFLLVDSVDGSPLSINTITNIISELKAASGISERSHPHMFRHRFITEKFKELIVHYDLQNSDVMRRAIANSDVIKRVLQEWTGHKVTESLDRYIHLAFNELARMETVISDVFADASLKALSTIISDFEQDFRAGVISAIEQEEQTVSVVLDYVRTSK